MENYYKHINFKSIDLIGIQLQLVKPKSHLQISYTFFRSLCFFKCRGLWLQLDMILTVSMKHMYGNMSDMISFISERSSWRKEN